MPQLYFFTGIAHGGVVLPQWQCPGSDGDNCKAMDATMRTGQAGTFSWFSDAFWDDVVATFAAAAKYTCDSGGRARVWPRSGAIVV